MKKLNLQAYFVRWNALNELKTMKKNCLFEPKQQDGSMCFIKTKVDMNCFGVWAWAWAWA